MSWIDAREFTDDLKQTIHRLVEMDVDERIANDFSGIYEDIIDAIDCAQYHKNGGLALPYGRKCGVVSTVILKQIYPLITAQTNSIEFSYETDDDEYERVEYSESSDSFVEAAMAHVENIAGHESFDFTACRKNGPNGLRPRRCEASHCKCCCRVHDNDNTLILTFSEEKRCAWYHCEKDDNRKFIVFYKEH
jgi:hypothetical protein